MKHLKHAVLPLMLLSSSAFAQSSVTLYGVIDEGIDYTSNSGGKRAFDLQSGYVQGSRWGLKGTEDLGGGLKAVFQLENGFDVSSGKLGQGGRMFGRQAYVGLQSDQFGTVTFGRQYDSVVDFVAQMTAAGNWSTDGAKMCDAATTAAAAANATPEATKTLTPGLLERLMVSSPASG